MSFMPRQGIIKLVFVVLASTCAASSLLTAHNSDNVTILCASTFNEFAGYRPATSIEAATKSLHLDSSYTEIVGFFYSYLNVLRKKSNRYILAIDENPKALHDLNTPSADFWKELFKAVYSKPDGLRTRMGGRIIKAQLAAVFSDHFDNSPVLRLTEEMYTLVKQFHEENGPNHGFEYWRERYVHIIDVGSRESGLAFATALETVLEYLPPQHIFTVLDYLDNKALLNDSELTRKVFRDLGALKHENFRSFMGVGLLMVLASSPDIVEDWFDFVADKAFIPTAGGFEQLGQLIHLDLDDVSLDRYWHEILESLDYDNITDRRGIVWNWLINRRIIPPKSNPRIAKRAIASLNQDGFNENRLAIILQVGIDGRVREEANTAVPALREFFPRAAKSNHAATGASYLLEVADHLTPSDIRNVLAVPNFVITRDAAYTIAKKIDLPDVPVALTQLKSETKALRSFAVGLIERLKNEYQSTPSHIAFTPRDTEILQEFSNSGFGLERDLAERLAISLQTLSLDLDDSSAYSILKWMVSQNNSNDPHFQTIVTHFKENISASDLFSFVDFNNEIQFERLQTVITYINRYFIDEEFKPEFILSILSYLEYFGEQKTSTLYLHNFLIETISNRQLWGSLKESLLNKNRSELRFSDLALAALIHTTERSIPFPDKSTKELANMAREQGQDWLQFFPIKEKTKRIGQESIAFSEKTASRTAAAKVSLQTANRRYLLQLVSQKNWEQIIDRLTDNDPERRTQINALTTTQLIQLMSLCFEPDLPTAQLKLQQQLKKIVFDSVSMDQLPELLESRKVNVVQYALAILQHKQMKIEKTYPPRIHGLQPVIFALLQRLRHGGEQRLPVRRKIFDALTSLLSEVGLREFVAVTPDEAGFYISRSLSEYFQKDREQLRTVDLENVAEISLLFAKIPTAFEKLMAIFTPFHAFDVTQLPQPSNLAAVSLLTQTYDRLSPADTDERRTSNQLITRGLFAKLLAGLPGHSPEQLKLDVNIAKNEATKRSLLAIETFLTLEDRSFATSPILRKNEWTNPKFGYFQYLANPVADHDFHMREMLAKLQALREQNHDSTAELYWRMEELSLYYILNEELRQGRWAFDISEKSHEGFDVKSYDLRTGKIRNIEVKSKFLGWSSFKISKHQLSTSTAMKKDGREPFVFSVVTFDPQSGRISHEEKLYPTWEELWPYLKSDSATDFEFSRRGFETLRDF